MRKISRKTRQETWLNESRVIASLKPTEKRCQTNQPTDQPTDYPIDRVTETMACSVAYTLINEKWNNEAEKNH